MSTRKLFKLVGVLLAGLLLLVAVPLNPAASETNTSLRAWSCGPGRTRTDQPVKEAVYAKPTGSTPAQPLLQPDTVELQLWAPSSYASVLADIAAEFASVYPNITINVASLNSSDMLNQLMIAAQSGNMPDLILTSSAHIEALFEMGSLMELNRERLPYANLLNSSGETCNCAGGFFGFPVSVINLALFYNKDLFDFAGVDYPGGGWSYDDIFSVGDAFASMDVYTLAVANQSYYYYPMLTGFGGSIFSGPGPNVTLDSPESIEALSFAQEMIGNGYMPGEANAGDVNSLFLSGQAAMTFGGAWQINSLESSDVSYGITNLPDGGYPLVATQALMIGDSPYYDQAHTFIEFVSQDPYMAYISDVTGLPSPLESVLDSSRPALRDIAYAGANGAKEPYSTVSGVVYSNFDMAVVRAFSGEATAEEALMEAAANIREALGD